jgi:hypothetical protein
MVQVRRCIGRIPKGENIIMKKSDKKQIIALANKEIEATEELIQQIATDKEAYKLYILTCNKRRNQDRHWRERISRKKLSETLDAQHTPDTFTFSCLPLQELASKVLEGPDCTNSETIQSWMDITTELQLRDWGLYDILDGTDWTDVAQKRITTLTQILDGCFAQGEMPLRESILTAVPELEYYELDSVFAHSRYNAPRLFHGDVSDRKGFVIFATELLVLESKRRVFIHKAAKQFSKTINKAIRDGLSWYRDLNLTETEESLFWNTLEWLLLENVYTEDLSELTNADFYKQTRKQVSKVVDTTMDRIRVERKLKSEQPDLFNSIFPEPELELTDAYNEE